MNRCEGSVYRSARKHVCESNVEEPDCRLSLIRNIDFTFSFRTRIRMQKCSSQECVHIGSLMTDPIRSPWRDTDMKPRTKLFCEKNEGDAEHSDENTSDIEVAMVVKIAANKILDFTIRSVGVAFLKVVSLVQIPIKANPLVLHVKLAGAIQSD